MTYSSRVMGWLKNIYEFRKLRKELLNLYKEENFIERLSQVYKIKFKVDRAARLYAVINPYLMNISNNSASQVYEYTENGMNDYEYIRRWVFTNLMAIAPVLAAENLLDVLLFDITEIFYDGKKTGNYRITFVPYNFNEYVKSKRKLLILLGILLLILIVGIITIVL